MIDQSCPQCGAADMNTPHPATCLHCGTPVQAASSDPADHLCGECAEKDRLVQFMLREALALYDHAVMCLPADNIGYGPGNPSAARTYLQQALTKMDRLSSPAIKAHPTYTYWYAKIQRDLRSLPQDEEFQP